VLDQDTVAEYGSGAYQSIHLRPQALASSNFMPTG
jgi:hypothetical protein